MSNPKMKKLSLTLIIFGVIITVSSLFLISTDKEKPLDQSLADQNKVPTTMNSAKNHHALEQDRIIHQRLYEDFENAFIKQYTPPLNCENLEQSSKNPDCAKHLLEAKEDFKQEFIKTRGLPKNAFDPHQFSYRN